MIKHILAAAMLALTITGCSHPQTELATAQSAQSIDPYNDPDGFITPARVELEQVAGHQP